MRGTAKATAAGAAIGMAMAGCLGGTPAQAASAVSAQATVVPCKAHALITAMTSATAGATLSLADKCVYVLTAALPEVGQNLTITGNGATLERSTATGTAAFTILTIDGGVTTLDAVSFRNGNGAISVGGSGQLSVVGGTFTGNTAADGGAISVSNVGNPSQVTGATFTDNKATSDGGAVYDNSPAISVGIANCTFTGNTAAAGGGFWEFGVGGNITGSTFRGNSGVGGGGAVWVSEAAPESFTDDVISDNTATAGEGGGIYSAPGGSGVVLDDSEIVDNDAGGDGGGAYFPEATGSYVTDTRIEQNTSGASGGGIENSGGIPIEFSGATVSSNYAGGSGGGIDSATDIAYVSLSGGSISSNRSGVDGGGINNQGSVQATSTPITGNTARSEGGGIYDDGAYAYVMLQDSPVTGNKPNNCRPPNTVTGCVG
jgi:Chlamydia polymorphic membrane protein (Chlamydia_PMP) repeat